VSGFSVCAEAATAAPQAKEDEEQSFHGSLHRISPGRKGSVSDGGTEGKVRRDKIPYRFLARDLDLAAFFRGLVLAGSGWRIAGGEQPAQGQGQHVCSTFPGDCFSSRARVPAILCVMRDITAFNISSWSLEKWSVFLAKGIEFLAAILIEARAQLRPRPAQFAPPSVCDESPALLRAESARFDSGGVTFVGGGVGHVLQVVEVAKENAADVAHRGVDVARHREIHDGSQGRFVRLCTIVLNFPRG